MMSGKPSVSANWNLPEHETDLDPVFDPKSGLQVIYKHSFRCAVCVFTKMKIEEFMENHQSAAEFHFVDVVKNRMLSIKIAEQTRVGHESPQVIVLKNGKVAGHASHSEINEQFLLEAIEA